MFLVALVDTTSVYVLCLALDSRCSSRLSTLEHNHSTPECLFSTTLYMYIYIRIYMALHRIPGTAGVSTLVVEDITLPLLPHSHSHLSPLSNNFSTRPPPSFLPDTAIPHVPLENMFCTSLRRRSSFSTALSSLTSGASLGLKGTPHKWIPPRLF